MVYNKTWLGIVAQELSVSSVTQAYIAGKKNDFENCRNRFFPSACLLRWHLSNDGLSQRGAGSLDGEFQMAKLLASGDLWGEVGGRVGSGKILRSIGLLSLLNGTDGNIRTHDG